MRKLFMAAAFVGGFAATAHAQEVVEGENAADKCVVSSVNKAAAAKHLAGNITIDGVEFATIADQCQSTSGMEPNIWTKRMGSMTVAPLYAAPRP